jgi:hypothetical protein
MTEFELRSLNRNVANIRIFCRSRRPSDTPFNIADPVVAW